MNNDQPEPEPLGEWLARRDARRESSRGRLRAVPLTSGPHRGAHIDPAMPRAIQRWDGDSWVPVTVAANLAETKKLLHPAPPPTTAPAPSWDRPALGPGTGRHRRTAPRDGAS
ncbi:DUF6087 family protein [Streptomyces sp. NPDC057638]|uniref:DUF6087 family protein n=1 Tax=Streptomyces sp. NPDC057638 TaxID=3346190 RepID=UPI0036C65047